MAKGEGGVEEVEMVKPSCFCKLNCESKPKRFKPLQNTYETVLPDENKRYDQRGRPLIKNPETGKWEPQHNSHHTSLDHKKCALIFLPILVLIIAAVLIVIWLARDADSSTFPSSGADSDLSSQIDHSVRWREENRDHVGVWFGCYRSLCRKHFSEEDYDRKFIMKIVHTVEGQFSTIVLDPPRIDQGHLLDNTRIPSYFSRKVQEHRSSVILTFDHAPKNFETVWKMATSVNRNLIEEEFVVTIFVLKEASLYESHLLGDSHLKTLQLLSSIREDYINLNPNYKLGLLIDRNDCAKWNYTGRSNTEMKEILKLVDVILYRTQHDYYKFTYPRMVGARRVPDNERQIKTADPGPYHSRMVEDLLQCEKKLKRAKQQPLDFFPVVNCDKYWFQTYINMVVHEHKNLENLMKCWQLASDWAKKRQRKVILLMDREIEKHGWFGHEHFKKEHGITEGDGEGKEREWVTFSD